MPENNSRTFFGPKSLTTIIKQRFGHLLPAMPRKKSRRVEQPSPEYTDWFDVAALVSALYECEESSLIWNDADGHRYRAQQVSCNFFTVAAILEAQFSVIDDQHLCRIKIKNISLRRG